MTEMLDDVNLHTTDSGGDGRPVLLLAGWPFTAESWSGQSEVLQGVGYRVVTYDRRGFGGSVPAAHDDFDGLADDLARVMNDLDLRDATLVGFSMGGGEVARYVARHGEERLHSVVFASSVTPFLLRSEENPRGPWSIEVAAEMRAQLERNPESFFEEFTTALFGTRDEAKGSLMQRRRAMALCRHADRAASLHYWDAFTTTDFRADLAAVSVPALVIHGEGDAALPYGGCGQWTHEAIAQSELVVLHGAPHCCYVSHPEVFNRSLLAFLEQPSLARVSA